MLTYLSDQLTLGYRIRQNTRGGKLSWFRGFDSTVNVFPRIFLPSFLQIISHQAVIGADYGLV